MEFENREIKRVVGLECNFLHFDAEGRLDQGERLRAQQHAVDSLSAMLTRQPRENGLINARQIFLRKQSDTQRWEPTTEIIEAIRKAIYVKRQSNQKQSRPPLRLV